MASTKCAWKEGSRAVSIFSIRPTTSWISVRARRESRAITAPAPAALPTLATRSGSQSGTRPSTVARTVSMWLPKAPADPVDPVDAQVVHQQSDPGVEGGLGQLDRPDVVL